MAYPVKLASVLTGATTGQLGYWRSSSLLVPETSTASPLLYSFRDLVAARTFVRLRATEGLSIQKVRRSLGNLRGMDFMEHPSEYRFATDGHTIGLYREGEVIDLLKQPGALMMDVSLAEVYAEFTNQRGDQVAPMLHPADGLEVKLGRLGGWPTISGTRIGYDTIAQFVDHDEQNLAYLRHFYPGVSERAARGAVVLADQVDAA